MHESGVRGREPIIQRSSRGALFHCAKSSGDWLAARFPLDQQKKAGPGEPGPAHGLTSDSAFINTWPHYLLQHVQSGHVQLAPHAQPAPHGQLQAAVLLEHFVQAGFAPLDAIPAAASAATNASDPNNLTIMRKLLVLGNRKKLIHEQRNRTLVAESIQPRTMHNAMRYLGCKLTRRGGDLQLRPIALTNLHIRQRRRQSKVLVSNLESRNNRPIRRLPGGRTAQARSLAGLPALCRDGFLATRFRRRLVATAPAATARLLAAGAAASRLPSRRRATLACAATAATGHRAARQRHREGHHQRQKLADDFSISLRHSILIFRH